MMLKKISVVLALLAFASPSFAQVAMSRNGGGSGSSGSSTITNGVTATSGCVAGGVLRSISNQVECGAGLTYASSILTAPVLSLTSNANAFYCTNCYGAVGSSNLLGVGSQLVGSGVGSPGVVADFSFRSAGRLLFMTGAVSHAMMDTTGAWTFGGAGTGVPVTINNGSAAVSPLVVKDNSGAVVTVPDGGGILLAAILFTNLPASTNGTQFYCSDCAQTTPYVDTTCAASGTGAMAYRLNGAWKCFN